MLIRIPYFTIFSNQTINNIENLNHGNSNPQCGCSYTNKSEAKDEEFKFDIA